MNDSELENKLRELNIEDIVWIVYIGIIFLSWYSNSLERKYLIEKNPEDKEKYRSIIVVIFFILIIVYIYFLKSSYEDIKNLKPTDSAKKRELVMLSFIASLLIAISGAIFLFIALADDNLDVELAFN